MHVLLTGGYGCIGSWIIRNLLERGAQAWVYDLKHDPRRLALILSHEQLQRVGYLAGDVTDLENIKSALRMHAITHVIHLAGLQVPTCKANPLLGQGKCARHAGGVRGGA